MDAARERLTQAELEATPPAGTALDPSAGWQPGAGFRPSMGGEGIVREDGLTDDERERLVKLLYGDPEATPPAGVLCRLCGRDHTGFNCAGKRLYTLFPGPAQIQGRRVRRNDPCPCGCGKKAKQCCMKRGFCFMRKGK